MTLPAPSSEEGLAEGEQVVARLAFSFISARPQEDHSAMSAVKGCCADSADAREPSLILIATHLLRCKVSLRHS